jgi:quercetin dioxygenase-like cupin family protein
MSERELWFLGTRVTVRVSQSDGADGLSVLEHLAPRGDSPPLHVHRDEDEVFHLLEGEARFLVGGRELRARAGETMLAPKGVPHTYRVESEHARWLTVTTGGFEAFVRAMSRPAEADGLPPAGGPPTPEQQQALSAVAAEHGIDLIGPPLG